MFVIKWLRAKRAKRARPEAVLMGNTIDCADACGLQVQASHVAFRIDGRLYAPACKGVS